MSGERRRGRPRKSSDEVGEEVRLVLDLALMVKRGVFDRVSSGDSDGTLAVLVGLERRLRSAALREVTKRRRGTAGALIGREPHDMLLPAPNRTAAAVRLVLEHGLTARKAATLIAGGLNERDTKRAVAGARARYRGDTARRAAFAATTEVTDAEGGDKQ